MPLETPYADWWEFAACANGDAERFFPGGRGTHLRRQVDAAKAICAGCPVRAKCLSWALTMNVSGVWGGCSEYERRRLKATAHDRSKTAVGRPPAVAAA
jgi:WhiB family redox-sensing transcriptional regulator